MRRTARQVRYSLEEFSQRKGGGRGFLEGEAAARYQEYPVLLLGMGIGGTMINYRTVTRMLRAGGYHFVEISSMGPV